MSTITENIQGTRSRFIEEKPIVKALREETLNVSYIELNETKYKGQDYLQVINVRILHPFW